MYETAEIAALFALILCNFVVTHSCLTVLFLYSRASKVFTNHQMAVQNGCLECFAKVNWIYLVCTYIRIHLKYLYSFYLFVYNMPCSMYFHTWFTLCIQPLPVFLQGLEVNVQCSQLQAGVRQYLHRMIICLGDELLRYIPVAVSLLLKDCKVRM